MELLFSDSKTTANPDCLHSSLKFAVNCLFQYECSVIAWFQNKELKICMV